MDLRTKNDYDLDGREETMTDYMYIKKNKDEEDSPALKTAWMHQFEYSKTPLKRIKKE